MALLTTDLDAVNLMLSNIGESPVNTVENNGVVDAILAKQILDNTNITVQTSGWHFNTEPDVTLTPTYPEKNLTLPANILKIDTTGNSKTLDVVQRGNRLYDRRKHTYTFENAVTVDLVLLLPFLELPQVAKTYITIKASRIFQERIVGAEKHSAFNAKDEARALSELNIAHVQNGDYNILTDNMTTYTAIDRGI